VGDTVQWCSKYHDGLHVANHHIMPPSHTAAGAYALSSALSSPPTVDVLEPLAPSWVAQLAEPITVPVTVYVRVLATAGTLKQLLRCGGKYAEVPPQCGEHTAVWLAAQGCQCSGVHCSIRWEHLQSGKQNTVVATPFAAASDVCC